MFWIILMYLFLNVESYAFNHNNATINYPCTTDGECLKLNLRNSLCISNVCVCENREYCTESMMIMKRVKGIGQNCNEPNECIMDNSNCINRTCQCNKRFISSSTKRECLSLAESILSYCIEDVQCKQLNGVCVNNKCICSESTIEMNGFCLKNIGIGDVCKINDECSHIKNSNCAGAKCTCNIGHVPSGKYKCLLQAELLESACTENVQCTTTLGSGSECISNSCQCKELYHYKKSTNDCVRDLRETCSSHEDCHQPGKDPSRLECLIGECKCKYPYFEDQNYCIISGASHTIFSFVIFYVFSLLIFVIF